MFLLAEPYSSVFNDSVSCIGITTHTNHCCTAQPITALEPAIKVMEEVLMKHSGEGSLESPTIGISECLLSYPILGMRGTEPKKSGSKSSHVNAKHVNKNLEYL